MKQFLCVLFLAGFSAAIIAAENETAPADEVEYTENEFLTEPLDDELQQSEEENTEASRDENFIPTIRITEDLPVAFPVDI